MSLITFSCYFRTHSLDWKKNRLEIVGVLPVGPSSEGGKRKEEVQKNWFVALLQKVSDGLFFDHVTFVKTKGGRRKLKEEGCVNLMFCFSQ